MSEEKKKPARKPTAKKGGEDSDIKPEPKLPPFNPIEAVIMKYREFGWTVFPAPRESLNDIIAQKDKKLHFVQVVTQDTIDNPRYQGIAKNTFIQNAFSNSATPIFAHVITSARRGENNTKVLHATVTFENVNENARVIIGGRKAPLVEPEINKETEPVKKENDRRRFTNGRRD